MKELRWQHPTEEALERFLLKMSSEEELETVETHILACDACLEQLEALEIQIAAVRLALRKTESKGTPQGTLQPIGRRKGWSTGSKLSLVSASAALAAGLALFSIPRDVRITAYRGAATVTVVSEGHPLRVHLSADDLPPGLVEVVLAEDDGSLVWKGMSSIQDGAVNVTLPPIIKSGPHFLRLQSPPQADARGDLLREFVLEAKWTL